MVSGIKYTIKSNIWSTIYPARSVDIFKGRKQENIVDLIATLAINGDQNTTHIAEFLDHERFQKDSSTISEKLSEKIIEEMTSGLDDILFQTLSEILTEEITEKFDESVSEELEKKAYTKIPEYVDSTDYKIHQLKLIYKIHIRNDLNRLLTGRLKYFHGGTKKSNEVKRYLNPMDLEYVVITDTPENDKGKFIPQYFLTLKGFFLVVGYDLTHHELKLVIENASKISLFFCFIKKIMNETSISFVNEIFIKPIQTVLLRSDIFQGGDMNFYFSNFADVISNSLSKKMKTIDEKMKQDIMNKPDSYFSEKITSEFMKFHHTKSFSELIRIKKNLEIVDRDDLLYQFRVAGIESLMDNVFYSSKPKEDWYESLIDYFYPTEESKILFLKFGNDSEKYLMNKVMYSLSQTYVFFGYGFLPYTEKKLPRSKAWKRNQKYKKQDKAFFKKYGSKFKPRDEIDISNLY